MQKSFKIAYTEREKVKTAHWFAKNQTLAEYEFLKYSEGNFIDLVSCERAEYIISTITVNIPYPVILYVKIEFTAKGAEIIEAVSKGQSWIEYLYLNGYQNQIFRHYTIEPQLLEVQDHFLLESVIEQRPIIQKIAA